jgi:hypothetical protein
MRTKEIKSQDLIRLLQAIERRKVPAQGKGVRDEQ